jgi:3-hydroxyisobutyrate dehydrogenase-like beta-hydroxyacid dehydrogenase
MNIGILHPGEMGGSVAASARNSGHTVYWVSEGRSPQTRQRAESIGLADARTVATLCQTCSIIVSVCPPDAAEAVARSVLDQGFNGLYVDANAISPQRAIRIGQMMTDAGASFVDGGIVGGPAWKPGTTWLYLSGEDSQQAADCFSAGPLETCILGAEPGKASALKMCFAAYTKGTTALLCAILAAAESLDVRDALERQWSRDGSDFAVEAKRRATQVTAKAWRFAGEMDEIALTFSEAAIPSGFHLAAADIYRRLAGLRGEATPSLESVLAALLARETADGQ